MDYGYDYEIFCVVFNQNGTELMITINWIVLIKKSMGLLLLVTHVTLLLLDRFPLFRRKLRRSIPRKLNERKRKLQSVDPMLDQNSF